MDWRGRKRARGAVLVEYAFLLVAFFLPAVAGLVAGGSIMYGQYQATRAAILGPTP